MQRRADGKAVIRCPRTVVAVLVVVGAVACTPLVELSTLAGTPAGASASSDAMSIRLGAPGSPANRFGVPARDLRPGGVTERVLDVGVGGGHAADVTLRISVASSSLLDSARAGLQVAVDRCPTRWREHLSPPRDTCARHPRPVLRWQSLARVKHRGAMLIAHLQPRATAHLRLRIRLPASAQDQFQGLTTVVAATLAATS